MPNLNVTVIDSQKEGQNKNCAEVILLDICKVALEVKIIGTGK